MTEVSNRPAPHVAINWASMFYACMDIHCICGEHFHNDVWSQMQQSTEYVRCPHCERVLRLSNQTPLRCEPLKFDRRDPHVFVQWKGTELHGTGHCGCGNTWAIQRDFAYDESCTACGAQYKVESDLDITEVPADVVATLPAGVIAKPEKEDESLLAMPDLPVGGTSLDAAAALAQFVPEKRRLPDDKLIVLTDGPPVEPLILGHTHRLQVEPGSRLLILPDVHISDPNGLEVARRAVAEFGRMFPPAEIVLLGDFADEHIFRPDVRRGGKK